MAELEKKPRFKCLIIGGGLADGDWYNVTGLSALPTRGNSPAFAVLYAARMFGEPTPREKEKTEKERVTTTGKKRKLMLSPSRNTGSRPA